MFTGNSGHAVVGYAVKEGTGIQIYDPNYPGQARQITLDGGGSMYWVRVSFQALFRSLMDRS